MLACATRTNESRIQLTGEHSLGIGASDEVIIAELLERAVLSLETEHVEEVAACEERSGEHGGTPNESGDVDDSNCLRLVKGLGDVFEGSPCSVLKCALR